MSKVEDTVQQVEGVVEAFSNAKGKYALLLDMSDTWYSTFDVNHVKDVKKGDQVRLIIKETVSKRGGVFHNIVGPATIMEENPTGLSVVGRGVSPGEVIPSGPNPTRATPVLGEITFDKQRSIIRQSSWKNAIALVDAEPSLLEGCGGIDEVLDRVKQIKNMIEADCAGDNDKETVVSMLAEANKD